MHCINGEWSRKLSGGSVVDDVGCFNGGLLMASAMVCQECLMVVENGPK